MLLGIGCVHLPWRRQSLFPSRQLGETLLVVPVPEEELQVLGSKFDVDKVVHEVASSAWLMDMVSQ